MWQLFHHSLFNQQNIQVNLKINAQNMKSKVDIFTNTCNALAHTCDTFLNQNRELWNFWSGNLCLVSGGFHVANFGLFNRS